jgi:hypothetical protein
VACLLKAHPLVEGIPKICDRYRTINDRDGLFVEMRDRIQKNWRRYREPDRWPTRKNWALRVAPDFSSNPTKYIEKQLQKEIAIALELEGWGNDMPTASGLVDSRSRQMNVDIVHELTDGIELFEVKVASDTPYDAALQILRYGAIYTLYRLEPELASRFRWNRVLRAERVALKVLAPPGYYASSDVDLRSLEKQLDRQVGHFAVSMADPLETSFEFLTFPAGFNYQPGMDREVICDAVRSRHSPFAS